MRGLVRRGSTARWYRAAATLAVALLVAVTVAIAPPARRSEAAGAKPPSSSGKASADTVTADKPDVPDVRHLPEGPRRPNAAPLSAAGPPSTPDAPLNDLDRAKLQAKATGKPAHVASWDTETTTTFVNPDGSFSTTTSAGPVRVSTPNGFVPVDPTLVADASGVHPKATTGGLEFSDGGSSPLVTATAPPKPTGVPGEPEKADPNGAKVSVGAPGSLPKPTLSANTATYANVVAGGDVVLEATTTGFEVSLVFHSAPKQAPVIDLPVDFGPLRVQQQPNGDLQFTDAAGKPVGYSPAPVMFDATPAPPGTYAHSAKVASQLKTVGGHQVLEMRPDPAFFTDAATKYPVTVDPSQTLYPSVDTWVYDASPNTTNDTNQTLHMGYTGLTGRARTFMSFADSFIKDPRRHVTAATLKVYQNWATTCTATPVNVQGAAPLTGPGATWNNQPALDGHVWATASFNADQTLCPNQVGYKSIDVTPLAQQWQSNQGSTDTLALVAPNETDGSQAKGFYSAETIGTPQLTFDYLMQPDQATNLSPASGLVETLTPTLSATVGGGDGGGYAVLFEVTDTDSGQQVADYAVTAGPGKVQWNLKDTNDTLKVGGHYSWTVTNCEGYFPAYCAAPATGTFQVDPALAAGDRNYFTYDSHSLGSRATVKVNVASGNLAVENTDLHIAGTGLDLGLVRTYNSTTAQNGAMGQHWTMTRTPTVRLVKNPDGSFTYFDEMGTASLITKNSDGSYNTSGDLDASFIDAGGYGVYKLTFHHDRGLHHTGDQELFWNNYNNTQPGKEGLPWGGTDRNNNSIVLTYSGTQVTGAVDTHSRPVNYTYDGAGRITSVADPNSVSRSLGYAYNSAGDLTTFTDGAGHQTAYTYDANHNLIRITTGAGHVTNIAYDNQHRVTSLTTVVGGNDQTTTFAYTNNPQQNQDQTVVTDRNGNTTTYTYDNARRVTTTVDALTQKVAKSYDNNSNVTAVTDNANQAITNTYDPNGTNNLTSSAIPTGATQTWAYGNTNPNNPSGPYQATTVTDPQKNQTTAAYDNNGNPKSSTNQLASENTTTVAHQGDGSTTCGAKTGEVCSATDARGNKTMYNYDAQGNMTGVSPPAPLGHVTIAYDALSRPTSVTDGRGQVTTYTYDDLDRITHTGYSDQTSISYTYDNDGNTTARTDRDGSQWTYTYDANNRLTHSTGPETVGYTYDPQGNLTRLDAAGETVTYHYTKVNMADSVTDPAGITTITYDPSHDTWPTQLSFPNGSKQSTGYDASGRPANITGLDSTGATLTSFAYSYTGPKGDSALRQSTTTASDKTVYTYDALNRLTKAALTLNGAGSPNDTWAYTYDGASNRTSALHNGTGSLYGYNAADELTGGSATYDGNGNLTGATGYGFDSFGINAANQTSGVTPTNKPHVGMAYAGATQNHWRTHGATGNVISHVTAGSLGIVSQTKAGATTHYTRLSSGQLIDQRGPGGTFYYLTDAQGSISVTTDNTGKLASRYTYDPYGNDYATVGLVDNPWRYAAGYKDDQTGLYKYGARYYNPDLGQWTQRDPSGQDPNPYTYTGGKPTTASDPTGLFCIAGVVGTTCDNGGGSYCSLSNFDPIKCLKEDFDKAKKHPISSGLTVLGCALAISQGGVNFWNDVGCVGGLTAFKVED